MNYSNCVICGNGIPINDRICDGCSIVYAITQDGDIEPRMELIQEALKSNCYDLCPELSSHDNVGFWKGFNKAVEIMKETYLKK